MKEIVSSRLINLVAETQREVRGSNSIYSENFFPELHTHPIPYFGQLEDAEILTVGLNPSSDEFRSGRWPDQQLDPENLAGRLCGYFQRDDPAWHPWFDKWTAALSSLNANLRYQTGQVAHIDLSPRATKAARHIPRPDLFSEMIRRDLSWFPALLDCAKAARILLFAGTVNSEQYLIEFLSAHGREHGLHVARSDGQSRRSLGFYELQFRSRRWPVFFSGSGPSALDGGAKLLENVTRHRKQILVLASCGD